MDRKAIIDIISELRRRHGDAVAHRDYSHFVRGSHIQIRLFADRLEFENPGGLYGGVTIDNLQEGQSTRNRLLMQLMEDVHLVDNRGSGIDAMLAAMQKRGLPAPVFEDMMVFLSGKALSGETHPAHRRGSKNHRLCEGARLYKES